MEQWPVSEILKVSRAVVRSENPGVPVLFSGHNLPPLVVIGLTDLPKSGTPRDNRPDLMVRKGFFTRPQISAWDKERSAQLDVAFLPQIAISLLLFVIGSLLNVKTNLEIIEVALKN